MGSPRRHPYKCPRPRPSTQTSGKGKGSPLKSSVPPSPPLVKSPSASGPSIGWVKQPPKQPEVKFALDSQEWSVPPVSELVPGQAGVMFCESASIAHAQLARVSETSQPAAVIVKQPLSECPGQSPEPLVFRIIKTEKDKPPVPVAVWGHLYNVGPSPVKHTSKVGGDQHQRDSWHHYPALLRLRLIIVKPLRGQKSTKGNSLPCANLCYSVCDAHPGGVTSTDVVDVFKLAKAGDIASVVVRVRASALNRCLTTSGTSGLFFRPLGPQTEEYGVTWLKADKAKDLSHAHSLCHDVKGMGLALRPAGLGIRAPQSEHERVRQALGRDPYQQRWLLSNVAWQCADSDVAELLQAAGWKAAPLHQIRSRGGCTRQCHLGRDCP